MIYLLVFPLMLAQTALSCTEEMVEKTCCEKCPAGYFAKEHCSSTKLYNCTKCDEGTYTAIENQAEKCLRCNPCQGGQVQTNRCQYNKDRECGCRAGYFRDKKHDSPICKKCDECKDQSICSECCNPTIYKDTVKMCRICKTQFCSITTAATRAPIQSTTKSNPRQDIFSTPVTGLNHSPVMVPLVVLVAIILVTGLLILTRVCLIGSRRPCWNMDKDFELPGRDNLHGARPCRSPICMTSPIRPEEIPVMLISHSSSKTVHSDSVTPLLPEPGQEIRTERFPATVLYAIINEVPLRRWKEFLRLLTVTDRQLERVELEAGPGLGSIEKQYIMLRLWSQRPAAALDEVFSVLNYMDLAGCAHQLQEHLDKLQWCTSAGRMVTQPVTSP